MIDAPVSRRMFIGGGLAAAGMLSAVGATFLPLSAVAEDAAWAVPQVTDIAEVISTDIAIIGGGFSGMTCAVQTALNGDRVVLIESQGKLGGGGMALEITCGVNSQLSAENGIDYEPSELIRAEMENAAWCADGMLWADLIKNSGANIDWLVEQGVEYEPVVDEYRIMQFSGAYKVAHWYKEGYAGAGYVPQMTERIDGLDIDVLTNTRAFEFVCDDSGKVTGVLCSDVNGETIQINAHVFIVATGSFAQNEELLASEGFRPSEIDVLAMPGHFGDGIRMVKSVGGTPFQGGTALIYNRIGDLWTFADLNGSICSGGPFLWVNEEGIRYTDENIALDKKVCPLEAVQTQIHKSCYTVFDALIQILVYPAVFVVLCILPLASGWMLAHRVSMGLMEDPPSRPAVFESGRLLGVDLRIVAALCLINLALGYVLRAGSYANEPEGNAMVAFYLSRGLVAACFFLVARRTRCKSVRPFTKVGLLVMVAGTLCLLLIDTSEVLGTWSTVLFSAGFVCFDIFTWAILAELAANSGHCRTGIFAAGQMFVYAFEAFGVLLAILGTSMAAGPIAGLGASVSQLIAVGLAFALTVGCVLVFDNDSGIWTQLSFGLQPGISDGGETEDSFAEQMRLHGLTAREAQVAMLLAEGRTYRVIAEKLYVSQDTVKVHVKTIYQKFGVHSKQDFIEIATGGVVPGDQ